MLQLKEFQQKAKHNKKDNCSDGETGRQEVQHEDEQEMTVSTHSSLSRQSAEEERPVADDGSAAILPDFESSHDNVKEQQQVSGSKNIFI